MKDSYFNTMQTYLLLLKEKCGQFLSFASISRLTSLFNRLLATAKNHRLTTIKNLFYILKSERRMFIIFTLIITFTSIFESIGIGSLYPIVDIFGNESKRQVYVNNFNKWLPFSLSESKFIPFLFFLIAVVILIKGIFFIVSFYMQYRLSETLRTDWQNRIFSNYLYQEYDFFVRHQTGDLIQRQMAQTDMAGSAITYSCEMVRNFIMAAFLYIMLCTISLKATLVVTVLLFILSMISLAFSRIKIYASSEEHARLQQRAYSLAVEAIVGIRQVKAFMAEEFFKKNFSNVTRKKALIYIRNATLGQSPHPVMQTLAMLGIIVILYFTIQHSGNTQSIVPLITVFGGGIYRIIGLLSGINSNIMTMGQVLPSVNIVANLLSMKLSYRKQSEIGRFRKTLRFENVTFSYNQSKFYISDLDMCFEKGKFYGIVGPSGSGKSTLVDLIIGLYKPLSGRVLVDERNLDEVDIYSWRKQIGLISQDTYIFNGTVEENISFAVDGSKVNNERVEVSARIADIYDFIMELPQGYQTSVGERGMKLSGGQRQRLAIARAVYRDPEIYIFDEATSSLDAVSERKIQKAIENIAQTKTVIAIAHRLSTVINADEIFVLNNGRIVEKGTHLELLQRKGFYNELYANQAGQGIANEANPVSA